MSSVDWLDGVLVSKERGIQYVTYMIHCKHGNETKSSTVHERNASCSRVMTWFSGFSLNLFGKIAILKRNLSYRDNVVYTVEESVLEPFGCATLVQRVHVRSIVCFFFLRLSLSLSSHNYILYPNNIYINQYQHEAHHHRIPFRRRRRLCPRLPKVVLHRLEHGVRKRTWCPSPTWLL